jgi:hypothetical protein
MTGPNRAPTRWVPYRWAKNSRVKMVTDTGRTRWCRLGATTVMPSTADSTEIAGVMTESP